MGLKRTQRRVRLILESLEDRINLAPTLFADVMLPGAGATWDFSRVGAGASPIFADLSGNGSDDIITVSADRQLYAYSYNSTTGQPSIFQHYVLPAGSGQLQSTPVVVSLPGGPAIFVGTSTGMVFGFDARSGAVLPGWPQSVGYQETGYPLFAADTILGHIAAGDLEGTGVPDIVVTSLNALVTAFRPDGSVLWRYSNDDTIFSGVAIADLNADGSLEVVLGGDSTASQYYFAGGRIVCLSAFGRREWIKNTDQVIWSSPSVADLTGTGKLDVIVGTGYFYPGVGNKVYAVDSQGHDLAGWPYITDPNPAIGAQVYSAPAIGDLNGDGFLDVVIADGQGRIHAISGKPGDTVGGVQRALWVVQAFPTPPAGAFLSSPILADINSDGIPDVIMGDTAGILRGFSGVDGSKIFEHVENPSTGHGLEYTNAAAVGQFKPGAGLQLAVVGNTVPNPTTVESPGRMLIFDLDPSTLTPPWGQFRQDASNDAVARPDALPGGFFSDFALLSSLYQGALGRAPVAQDLAIWLPFMRHAPSLRSTISFIVAGSESRDRLITSWYMNYLGRPPEPAALGPNGGYQNAMSAGTTYAALEAGILGSQESFNFAGGTNATWVPFLYQQVLGRPPGNGEAAPWINYLNANPNNRGQVAQIFFQSNEARVRLITGWYHAFGNVTPPVDSQAALILDLGRGKTEEQCLIDVLNSFGDYVTTQQEGSWLRAIYMQVLHRPITPGESIGWLVAFQNGSTFFSIAKAILESDEYLNDLVTGWFQSYLQRTPGTTEANSYVSALKAGTPRVTLIAGIISSSEYFATRAGNDLTNFITQVAQDLQGHPPDSTEIAFWQARQAQVGDTRTFMPQFILSGQYSGEYFKLTLTQWYYAYLARYPQTPTYQGRILTATSPFGAQSFVDAWENGANPEDLQAAILSSTEYLQLARQKAFWLGDRWRQ
jgi:hypothetical protein